MGEYHYDGEQENNENNSKHSARAKRVSIEIGSSLLYRFEIVGKKELIQFIQKGNRLRLGEDGRVAVAVEEELGRVLVERGLQIIF